MEDKKFLGIGKTNLAALIALIVTVLNIIPATSVFIGKYVEILYALCGALGIFGIRAAVTKMVSAMKEIK